jgi:hypothetical protein
VKRLQRRWTRMDEGCSLEEDEVEVKDAVVISREWVLTGDGNGVDGSGLTVSQSLSLFHLSGLVLIRALFSSRALMIGPLTANSTAKSTSNSSRIIKSMNRAARPGHRHFQHQLGF